MSDSSSDEIYFGDSVVCSAAKALASGKQASFRKRPTAVAASTSTKRQVIANAPKAPAAPTKRNIFEVIGKVPPAKRAKVVGRATNRGGGAGGGGVIAWYHRYWRPKDQEKYPGVVHKDPQLRQRLKEDNARMECIPCKNAEPDCESMHPWAPTTYFKYHLLKSCAAFANSDEYQSPDVLKELGKLASKERKVCLQQPYFTDHGALLVMDACTC